MTPFRFNRIVLALIFAAAAVFSFAEGEQETGRGESYGYRRGAPVPLEKEQGLIIVRVLEDSPAEQAGLVRGDIIMTMEGKKLYHVADIRDILEGKKGGEKVTCQVVHGSETKEVTVTLEDRLYRPPIGVVFARAGETEPRGPGSGPGRHYRFGSEFPLHMFRQFLENLPEDYDFEKLSGGVVVTEVFEDSPAYKAGIEEEDLIYRIDDTDLTWDESVNEVFTQYRAGDEVQISIIRDDKEKTVTVILEENEEGGALLGITYMKFPFFRHMDSDWDSPSPGRGAMMFKFYGPHRGGPERHFRGEGRFSGTPGGI